MVTAVNVKLNGAIELENSKEQESGLRSSQEPWNVWEANAESNPNRAMAADSGLSFEQIQKLDTSLTNCED